MNGPTAFGLAAMSVSLAVVILGIVNAVLKARLHERPKLDPEVADRLARMEAAIDTIAVEVERIGEAQRFNARLASGMPAGVALDEARPVAVPRGDAR